MRTWPKKGEVKQFLSEWAERGSGSMLSSRKLTSITHQHRLKKFPGTQMSPTPMVYRSPCTTSSKRYRKLSRLLWQFQESSQLFWEWMLFCWLEQPLWLVLQRKGILPKAVSVLYLVTALSSAFGRSQEESPLLAGEQLLLLNVYDQCIWLHS